MSLAQIAWVHRRKLEETLKEMGIPSKLAWDVIRRLPYKTAEEFDHELRRVVPALRRDEG